MRSPKFSSHQLYLLSNSTKSYPEWIKENDDILTRINPPGPVEEEDLKALGITLPAEVPSKMQEQRDYAVELLKDVCRYGDENKPVLPGGGLRRCIEKLVDEVETGVEEPIRYAKRGEE